MRNPPTTEEYRIWLWRLNHNVGRRRRGVAAVKYRYHSDDLVIRRREFYAECSLQMFVANDVPKIAGILHISCSPL
jgi:hypothetical protein